MSEIGRIVQTPPSIRRFVLDQANDGSPTLTRRRCCEGSKQPLGSLAPALGGPDDAVMAGNSRWICGVPDGGYSVASAVEGSA
jgi:hypothetical protein